MDGDEDVEWKDSDGNNLVDSSGKPHETYHEDSKRNQDDTKDSLCATGEPDGDGSADWIDSEDGDFIDSEGKLYECNMEFDIGIEMIQTAFFVLKVSRMTMKMSSGETITMMAPSIVMVSPMKPILKIDIGIRMILTTLFVLQVRQMVTKISSGVTVMIILLIVKVTLMKQIINSISELGLY